MAMQASIEADFWRRIRFSSRSATQLLWIVLLISTGNASATDDPAPIDPKIALSQTVVVRVSDERALVPDLTYNHLGVVVQQEFVITGSLAASVGDRFSVILPQSGAELSATVSGIKGEFAILSVRGLGASPPHVSLQALAAGRRIIAVGLTAPKDIDLVSGVLARELSPGATIRHSAPTDDQSYGGPIFDECGRLVAMNMLYSGIKLDDLRRQKTAKESASSRGLADAMQLLSELKIAVSVDDRRCPSDEERTVKLAEAEQQLQREAREKADAERKLAEAERAAAEDARAQAELARKQMLTAKQLAERLADEAAALSAATEAEKKAADERARVAKSEADTAESALAVAEAEATRREQELQGKLTKNAQIQAYLSYGLVGGALVLLLAVGAWIRSRARVNKTVAEAQLAVDDARKAAEAQRREMEASITPPFADVLLKGEGHVVKLSGENLPKAAGGVTVGRDPDVAQAILAHPSISRRHARFFSSNRALYVQDLGSANGVELDGKLIEPGLEALVLTLDKTGKPGTSIVLGEVELAVIILDQ